jgi:hypothetical protein
MDSDELRLEALRLAASNSGVAVPSRQITEAAMEFYRFLRATEGELLLSDIRRMCRDTTSDSHSDASPTETHPA